MLDVCLIADYIFHCMADEGHFSNILNSGSRSQTHRRPAHSNSEIITVHPKAPGFFISYIIFSIPGFISGVVWIIISIVILFGISGGIADASSQAQSSSQLSFDIIKQNNAAQDILIYDLNGAIDTGSRAMPSSSKNAGIYTELIAKDFEQIKKDTRIKGIVFRVNTPGGTIFASEVLGDLISDILKSKNQSQPVFFYDAVVASGGLFATMKVKDSYIIASPYGETGSIGVIATLPNFSGLADKVGYSETVIKSSQSKDIGNPLRQLTPDEKSFLQKQVDDKYNIFVNIVANSRKIDVTRVKEIANGYVYDNPQAKDLGLIDELGNIDQAVEKVASNQQLSSYNLLQIKQEFSPLEDLLGAHSINIPKILGLDQLQKSTTTLKPGILYMIDELKV